MLESMDALAPREGCLQSCDVDEFWTSVEPIRYTFLIYVRLIKDPPATRRRYEYICPSLG